MSAKKKRIEAMSQVRESLAADAKRSVRDALEKWRRYVNGFSEKARMIDDKYETQIERIEKLTKIMSERMKEINERNRALEAKISDKNIQRIRKACEAKSSLHDISAEIDLEVQLQRKAVDTRRSYEAVQRQLNEVKTEKVRLKKLYVRNIREFNEMEGLEDQKRRKMKIAKHRKSLLQKENEEKERMAKESEVKEETRQKKRYEEILAAAGHKASQFDEKMTLCEDVLPEPQEPYTSKLQTLPRPAISNSAESVIRSLLSTGNYTENDPTIRSLMAAFEGKEYNF